MATIGVQLMMVRDKIAAEGLAPVLERLAALGYEVVEVSQVPTDAANPSTPWTPPDASSDCRSRRCRSA